MRFDSPTTIPSGIHGGAASVQQMAEAALRAELEALEAGTSEQHDETRQRAVTFMTSGGGPSTWVTFLLDDDGRPTEAHMLYVESAGRAAVAVPEWAVRRMYNTLKNYGK